MMLPEGSKAKILLLSGFLGAGKTTLLRNILAWKADLSDTVVVVNEFGRVGIDGALIQGAASEVVELANGCICCTMRSDLKQTMLEVRRRYTPRWIYVEATGVADPATILSLLEEPDMKGAFELHSVVTVLDADYWDARDAFGPLFFSQLSNADVVLLNKIDIVEPEQVPVFLQEMHECLPGAIIVPTIHCRLDPETLWSAPRLRTVKARPEPVFPMAERSALEGTGKAPRSSIEEPGGRLAKSVTGFDAPRYLTFTFESARVVSEDSFSRFLEEVPWELFRIKGPVRFAKGTSVLNFVGGRHTWELWQGPQETRLAFVGWEVDPETVIARLEQCFV